VNDLTVSLLAAVLATNQPQAISNLVQQRTGVSVQLTNPNDPVKQELRNVMIDDDAAIDDVQAWTSTNQISQIDTNGLAHLHAKVRDRLDGVKQKYEHFLRNHPDNARGFLAYGSFLHDIGEEDAAKAQYENSKLIDPKNPAVWNQLANYYGEFGELTNAFAYYTEAIRLDPVEPVYYQNFATTVYLYRKDAREFYHLTEQQVFDKALDLYRQAMKLSPDNLVLATDYAESYYGIKPMRTNDALAAWSDCLKLCKDDNEREGVLIHLARVKISVGLYDEAQAHLHTITNAAFVDLRKRLERSLADHKARTNESASITVTNVPAAPAPPVVSPTPPATPAPPEILPATVTNLEAAPPGLRSPGN
jgi:tetratricopeptide (TPR) repeat protein